MDNLSDSKKSEIIESAKSTAGIAAQEVLEIRSGIRAVTYVVAPNDVDFEVMVMAALFNKGTFDDETGGGVKYDSGS